MRIFFWTFLTLLVIAGIVSGIWWGVTVHNDNERTKYDHCHTEGGTHRVVVKDVKGNDSENSDSGTYCVVILYKE